MGTHNRPTLYQALKASGVKLDNHESDLYAKSCAISRAILSSYAVRATTFVSNIDGDLWFDVPFLFDPWWESRGCTVNPNATVTP